MRAHSPKIFSAQILIKEEREKLMKLYKELVRIINDPEDRRIKT
jgi:hypothetical protein